MFRCLSVAELMEKSANCGGRDEKQEGEGKRTENLNDESLRGHTDIIQETDLKTQGQPPLLRT